MDESWAPPPDIGEVGAHAWVDGDGDMLAPQCDDRTSSVPGSSRMNNLLIDHG
jgi:hypothetical protein